MSVSGDDAEFPSAEVEREFRYTRCESAGYVVPLTPPVALPMHIR